MLRLQAFRYELRPDGEQERNLRRFAGSRRFVFNKALALQKQRYEQGEKKLGYAALCKELTGWRNSEGTPWLADAPVHPLQQALRDLERAYVNFFEGRAQFPAFKKKGQDESFRYPDPAQIKFEQGNNRLFLPKLGWLRYRNSRKPKKGRAIDRASRKAVEGELRNVTVLLKGGKYFVSIQTQREVEIPVHRSTSVIGIDLGIARFAAMDDGSFIPPLNSLKKHQNRLRRYQRMLARRTKFGQNWKKAKAKVSRLQTHIANCRKDFLHKESTKAAKTHGVICVEDLKVKNMTASAKGAIDRPGRNVKQKSGLNRAILDQGWGEFRRQLQYKLDWAGGVLVTAPPQYTSQECPGCHHVSPDNRRTQARFLCVACGFTANADVVGAINIKRAAGYAASAWSGTSPEVGASDQEPTEATQAVPA